jgi:hypothetical protein
MGRDLGILVLSCDKYSDLWKPFLRQFGRFFPRGEYPVYVGSNSIACTEPGVVPVLSGDDPDWSTSLKRILAQVPHKKLFIILEDLFLASPVDRDAFESALRCVFDRDALHVKYWANPMPDQPTEDPNVGIHAPGAPYRATVCGFWDRDYLMKLLIEGENPWNFEILGSYRASYGRGIYGLTRPLCEVRNMVEKGFWMPGALEWAREQGIEVRADARPVLVGGNKLLSRLKAVYFDLMLSIPWRFRVALMNKLRRAFISY